jgi:lysozyme
MSKGRIAGAISAGALALAAAFVPNWEGERLEPYLDVGGVLTVCDGETKGVENRRYTPAECKAMLLASLEDHGAAIAPCLPEGLPDNVQAASLSFAYNVGASAFCKSKMAAQLKAGNTAQACAELSRWVFVAGRDCRDPANRCAGIVKRRAAERAMCEGRS